MAARTASARPIKAFGESGSAAWTGSASGAATAKANAIREIGLIDAPLQPNVPDSAENQP
jgi:hypothetical protein